MSNTSASGGYILPTSSGPSLGSLTFIQFLQTLFVGVSGFDGKLVRPKWQINPPKMPGIDENWMAFGIAGDNPDTFAYSGMDADGNSDFQRNTRIEIQCTIYGPDAYENVCLIRDGLQITQNLEALQIAKMGLQNTSPAIHAPEKINERYFDRYDFTVILNRLVQRVYPILSFVSASGNISTVIGNEDYLLDWTTEIEET